MPADQPSAPATLWVLVCGRATPNNRAYFAEQDAEHKTADACWWCHQRPRLVRYERATT